MNRGSERQSFPAPRRTHDIRFGGEFPPGKRVERAGGALIVSADGLMHSFRGDEIRPETQRMMVQGDPHPIAKYRVIGPISNLPAFATTFGCKAGAPMVRPPEKRCEVW